MPQTIRESLRSLIELGHPLIVCETVEEERLTKFVELAAEDLTRQLFDWSKANGFRRAMRHEKGDPFAKTEDPQLALRYASGLKIPSVMLFKDLGPYLKEPAVVRTLREALFHLREAGASMILSGDALDLPAELQPLLVRFELPPPNPSRVECVGRYLIEDAREAS